MNLQQAFHKSDAPGRGALHSTHQVTLAAKTGVALTILPTMLPEPEGGADARNTTPDMVGRVSVRPAAEGGLPSTCCNTAPPIEWAMTMGGTLVRKESMKCAMSDAWLARVPPTYTAPGS
jgi:hypothetical protein